MCYELWHCCQNVWRKSHCMDDFFGNESPYCYFLIGEVDGNRKIIALCSLMVKYLLCQFLSPVQSNEEDINPQTLDMGSRIPTIHHFNHSSYFCISFYTEPCSIQSVPKAIAIRQKHMILHIKKQHSYIVYIQFIIVCQRTKVCWILQQWSYP